MRNRKFEKDRTKKSWLYTSSLMATFAMLGFTGIVAQADDTSQPATVETTGISETASTSENSQNTTPTDASSQTNTTSADTGGGAVSAANTTSESASTTPSDTDSTKSSASAVSQGSSPATPEVSPASVKTTNATIESNQSQATNTSAQVTSASTTASVNNSYYLTNNAAQELTLTNTVSSNNAFANNNTLANPNFVIGQYTIQTTLPAGITYDGNLQFQISTNGTDLNGPMLNNSDFDTTVTQNADGTTTVTSSLNQVGATEAGTWADNYYNSTVWAAFWIKRTFNATFAENQANAQTNIDTQFISASLFTPNNPTSLFSRTNVNKETSNVDENGSPLTIDQLNSGNYVFVNTDQTATNNPADIFGVGYISQGTSTSVAQIWGSSVPGDHISISVNTLNASGQEVTLSGSGIAVQSDGHWEVTLPTGYTLFNGSVITVTSNLLGETRTTTWDTSYVNDGKTADSNIDIDVVNHWALATQNVYVSLVNRPDGATSWGPNGIGDSSAWVGNNNAAMTGLPSDNDLAVANYTYTVTGPDGKTYASMADALAANPNYDADSLVDQKFVVTYTKNIETPPVVPPVTPPATPPKEPSVPPVAPPATPSHPTAPTKTSTGSKMPSQSKETNSPSVLPATGDTVGNMGLMYGGFATLGALGLAGFVGKKRRKLLEASKKAAEAVNYKRD